ncbi:lytic transglycosylase domain-containing protein [Streptomyces physcomitrii]|uniref:Lytic transglycosylase domain-containing protein n=1 Tax=Streptomyces physcomitrii TaxID=2724184 RepID=A0ABX1H7Q4_9ACTN|nr:lytic transglycosylase domain-containing protein [Streptomyces physcomitrii]NKI43051.1 lytic transglycosylase domain-containing protein [Streptomyces physcomitrii]
MTGGSRGSRRPRRRLRRLRHGARGTAVAVAAVALLTASGAPALVREAADRDGTAGESTAPARAPGPAEGPGDGSYHTELPPLGAEMGIGMVPDAVQIRAQSGIPATVLAAYRGAEASVRRSDPGCRLPWHLLAAIGKVESGQASGGAVTADGTTRGRILGPALDGKGFALIRDSDGGAYDGDRVYDRAVGPMQFLPTTWARWGADGNGDGRRDPDNVFDAALAAGHYLCAGPRDLSVPADLDRAVLSYNHSREYLQLVRYWLEFYRNAVHAVPDGTGVVPASPGAGGKTPATRPVGGEGGGGKGSGGIIIGPKPSPTSSGSQAPGHPDRPDPSTSPGPDPSDTGGPSPDPTGSGSPTGEPTPTAPGEPSDCPTDTTSPTPPNSPSPTPTPGEEDGDPCGEPTPTSTTSRP